MSKVKFTSIDNFDGFEGMLNSELLWTNASPTSSFGAQTINIDLSKYKYVYIAFLSMITSAGVNRYFNFLLPVGLLSICSGAGNYSANRTVSRYVDVTTTGIEFYPTYYTENYAATATQRNDMLIPYQIYGLN